MSGTSGRRELVHEGSPGRDAFLVLEGTARVTAAGRLLAHVGPGDFVGEMALLDGGRRSASVTADSAMRVLAFDAPAFAALLDDPAFCRTLAPSARRSPAVSIYNITTGGTDNEETARFSGAAWCWRWD